MYNYSFGELLPEINSWLVDVSYYFRYDKPNSYSRFSGCYWAYPFASSSAKEAVFNMVSTMLCRIHLSFELDKLKPAAMAQVVNGVSVYKNNSSKYIPQSTPFFPMGMPSFTDSVSAIAVVMKHAEKRFIAVWRLTGKKQVSIPVINAPIAKIIYPANLGNGLKKDAKRFTLTFPKSIWPWLLK